jgi:WD40 repeat protein
MNIILLCQACGVFPAQAACNCKSKVTYFCMKHLNQHLTDIYISHNPISIHKSINLHLDFSQIYQDRQVRYRNSPSVPSTSSRNHRSVLSSPNPLLKAADTRKRSATFSEISTISSSLHSPDFHCNEVHAFKGHLEKVNCLAMSSCGRFILSGSDDCGIFVWNIKKKKFYGLIEVMSPVIKFAISKDGWNIAVASEDQVIRVFNVYRRRLEGCLVGHTNVVKCILYSRDGNKLISAAHDFKIKVWNVTTLRAEFEIYVGHLVIIESLAVSKNLRYIVPGYRNGNIAIWDTGTRSQISCFEGHTNWVTCLLLTRHNKFLISGSLDLSIRIWDLRKAQLQCKLMGHKNSIYSFVLTRDEKHLISASADFSIRIWSLDSYKQVSIIEGHSSCVNDVAVTQNDRYIVSASGGVMTDHTVRLWGLDSKKKCEVF